MMTALRKRSAGLDRGGPSIPTTRQVAPLTLMSAPTKRLPPRREASALPTTQPMDLVTRQKPSGRHVAVEFGPIVSAYAEHGEPICPSVPDCCREPLRPRSCALGTRDPRSERVQIVDLGRAMAIRYGDVFADDERTRIRAEGDAIHVGAEACDHGRGEHGGAQTGR